MACKLGARYSRISVPHQAHRRLSRLVIFRHARRGGRRTEHEPHTGEGNKHQCLAPLPASDRKENSMWHRLCTQSRHTIVQLAASASGAAGRIEPGVATAPAAPPPTTAVRAGTGAQVRTGAVTATYAQQGFGTAALRAQSGHEPSIIRIQPPGLGTHRHRRHCHGGLRILPGSGIPDQANTGTVRPVTATVTVALTCSWPAVRTLLGISSRAF
jgi:hypothetical protein